ncbi:DUF5676 family membrane protein [Ralstonia solanacearum]|uniref:DUF5676 family membrane protein n=1 Tax=Ralstonia solanacearum TaxID=305 RepID=UPI0005ACC233|nr:DUF5676 family membrane protein [Ralstonia solanacearum]MDC6177091.1 DUF5676 family membrane protein [Ralstonia solanacearum]MDC6238377.1 DUF5676 family membrane protein [Ralstonia solanacearum]
MKPFVTGVTLSATVIIFYTLCTLVWLAAPEPFMDFLGMLFHGVDFKKLQTGHALTWWAVLYPAVIFAVWFFAVGAFFAWLYNILSGQRENGAR